MILISKAYKGYLAGTVVQLATQEEAALVAQGFATVSAGPVTAGNVTTVATSGRVGIAAAGQTVTITNASITTESKFNVNLSNATPDATATFIARVTPAAGSVTFGLNAAATGAVAIDWMLLPSSQGLLPPN